MQGDVTKRMIRALMGNCCRFSGFLSMAERHNRSQLTILCYHRIMPMARKETYFVRDLVVTPESFSHHCRILMKYYEVLPLSEAIDSWKTTSKSNRPIATMTFDDGYCDNYEYAAPILKQFGLRATFFVVTGLVDTVTNTWYDRLARLTDYLQKEGRLQVILEQPTIRELLTFSVDKVADVNCIPHGMVSAAKSLDIEKRQLLLQQLEAASGHRQINNSDDRIMTWRELSDLVACGHEIGSHSLTHEILPQLDDISLESETVSSRQLLESRLGRPVRAFCYPNGDTDERVVKAINAAGYDYAVTTIPGCNAPTQDGFRLKRWFIHEGRLCGPAGATSETLLRMHICGLADRVFRRRQINAGVL